ncbi:MAG: PIN domain-containing protein [Armatimonadota bacterium]|nr:PIN domain-containing protein [Armatimonadota bacterium]
MSTFVDTSGLYAILDRDDGFHAPAAAGWQDFIEQRVPLVTHSYVLVETVALTQRRLGPPAVRVLRDDVIPVLDVVWVEERLHDMAMTALLAAGRRDVSLVDWVSFELMRLRGVLQAFAFDEHFVEQGFTLVPPAR